MPAVFKPYVVQSDPTSVVQRLLDVCDQRLDQIKALEAESRRLEEELALLKSRKGSRAKPGGA